MRRMLIVLVLALLVAAPAMANTDTFARNRISDHKKRIATLESQVKALTVLVENLKAKNARLETDLDVLEGKVNANISLIKALARQQGMLKGTIQNQEGQ